MALMSCSMQAVKSQVSTYTYLYKVAILDKSLICIMHLYSVLAIGKTSKYIWNAVRMNGVLV